MKKLILGAVFGLLAACGGGGGDDDVSLDPDASGGPDAMAECNPVTNTGCADGEKCTWVNVTDELGRIGCVGAGPQQTGEACEYGPDGDSTGFDNCVGGNVCIGGVCEVICDLSNDQCATGSRCSQYNIFANGTDTPPYGACDLICDPGTQKAIQGDQASCGSTAENARGCYGLFFPVQGGDGEFTCSPAGAAANTHGFDPATPYLNVCAPGYVLYFDSSAAFGSAEDMFKCIATCEPGAWNQGDQANKDGLVAGAATCHGAPPTGKGVIGANFECKFMHWHMNTIPDRDFNHNGICIDPTQWSYADLYGTPPGACNGTTVPSCATIAAGTMMDWDCNAATTDDVLEAELQWGCKPFVPAALTGGTVKEKFRQVKADVGFTRAAR